MSMSHAGTASSSGNTAVLRPACLARLGRRAKPGVRMACYSVALTPCLSPAHLPVRSSERDPHSPLHSPPPLRSLSAARRACTHEREARVAAGEERLLLRSVSPHDSFGGRRHPGDDKREQPSASPNTFYPGESGRARSPGRSSPYRIYARNRGQNEPGSPVYRATTSTSPQPRDELRERSAGRVRSGEHVGKDAFAAAGTRGERRDAGATELSAGSSTAQSNSQLSPRGGRRRGYFANLGTNAPGSPLHPSFEDARATTPFGSARCLSPRRTEGQKMLSCSEAEPAPLHPACATRTASLPRVDALQCKDDRSQFQPSEVMRPASARYGPTSKRCTKNADSRQSLSPRLSQHEIRQSKRHNPLPQSVAQGVRKQEAHEMAPDSCSSFACWQLDGEHGADLTNVSEASRGKHAYDPEARSDEAVAVATAMQRKPEASATNMQIERFQVFASEPGIQASSQGLEGSWQGLKGRLSSSGSSCGRREEGSETSKQNSSRLQICSSPRITASHHLPAGCCQKQKKKSQHLPRYMSLVRPGKSSVQGLTSTPALATRDRRGVLQGGEHKKTAGNDEEKLAVDESQSVGTRLLELTSQLMRVLQQFIASRRRDLAKVRDCARQMHAPNVGHLEACDACADAVFRELWRIKEENAAIESWHTQTHALLPDRTPQRRTLKNAATREGIMAAGLQGKRGLATARKDVAPGETRFRAPVPRHPNKQPHGEQNGHGKDALLWHRLLDSKVLPARALGSPQPDRASFFDGGTTPTSIWPPPVRNHEVNDEISSIAADPAMYERQRKAKFERRCYAQIFSMPDYRQHSTMFRPTGDNCSSMYNARVVRPSSSKGDYDAKMDERLSKGFELAEIMEELRVGGVVGARLASTCLAHAHGLAQVLQDLTSLRQEMDYLSVHLCKGNRHTQDRDTQEQTHPTLSANLPDTMRLEKLIAASRSKRIAALHPQPATHSEREDVVCLEDSFGQVDWPNSVNGYTVYKDQWHLQEGSKEEDPGSVPGASEEKGSASVPLLPEMSEKASVAEADSIRDTDASMLWERDMVEWPWCDEMGYESDGVEPSAFCLADSIEWEQDETSQASTEAAAQVFNYTRSKLQMASKTDTVATRTGTLDEQKRVSDNWMIKCFIMTPLELTVTKIQRCWRRKCKHRIYLERIKFQYLAHRKHLQRHEEVHRSIMKRQEDVYQRLVNRVRMFDCAVSKPKVREYIAARNIQCAIRCHQSRVFCNLLVTASLTIQRHYRRWVGARAARFKSRVRRLQWERNQVQLFRRQKFVATAVADQELQILESYSAIEQEMIKCRRGIEVQDQTSEQAFKTAAAKLQTKMLASADLKAWVPQIGSVSGKTHYLNTLTGEVLPYHPRRPVIDKSVKSLSDEMDALQRPQRHKMLAHLESLKGQHEEVYENVAELLSTLRELTFRAQFR